MKVFIILASIYIFIKISKYALYEYKNRQNKITGVILFLLSVIGSVGSSLAVLLK